MNFLSPIKISLKYLLAAKVRSFLTMLGIIIGVASVIMIMAIGQSAQALILDQVSGVGSNLIGILPGASDEEGPPAAVMGINITTLKYDDLEKLRDSKNVPEIEDGAGYAMGTASAKYDGNDENASFVGTTASYIGVQDSQVQRGRFFTRDEETNMARVAVIGQTIAKDLFGNDDPLNKVFELKKQNFTVIGIMEESGSSAFGLMNENESIFVPIRTAQKLLLGIDHLGFIRLKVSDSNLIESAILNAKITLREQHNIEDPINDDFSVRSQAAALEMIRSITDVLRYFLLTIGTISLIVGGVGIMNIMLIAVSQRIREVGLRKAVGAKNTDVMTQFLIESATISFLGGAMGIVIGIIFAYLISLVVSSLGYFWPFLVSFESVSVAAVVSILIGLVFGIYPARKASQISPMEALRYE
jgi:putative ABC transport system permease protein